VPFSTAQRINLNATAAITFHPMASTADEQNLFGIHGAFAHHIHGQLFAIASLFGMHVRLNLKP